MLLQFIVGLICLTISVYFIMRFTLRLQVKRFIQSVNQIVDLYCAYEVIVKKRMLTGAPLDLSFEDKKWDIKDDVQFATEYENLIDDALAKYEKIRWFAETNDTLKPYRGKLLALKNEVGFYRRERQ